MRLDHSQIRLLLPHRHPMVLVDRVEDLVPGVSLTAVKTISAGEPCYAGLPDGLSPDRYTYPVSLLIESFGQAAAVLWLVGSRRTDGIPMFAAARDCRFEHAVRPGDVLLHRVRLDQVVDGAAFASGETWAGATRIAVFGSLMAVVRPADRIQVAPVGATVGVESRTVERSLT